MNKQWFVSVAALLGITSVSTYPATAQIVTSPPAVTTTDALEPVTVSASRITIAGYDQPTPVTVVNLAQLQRDARVDIGDVLRELPSVGSSSSPNNSIYSNYATNGTEGLDLVNLRNLGANRTLVLVDGQRVVSSNLATGGVDLTTIPSSLIERVDVVTGGASAAWGSDAVAGVVNLIINKKFDGAQINLEDSDNWQSSHPQRKVEVSLGTDFDGDRGHVILSGSYVDAPDAFFSDQTPGFDYQRLVTNPAYAPGNGQPLLIHANAVGLVQATPGGIITGGPLTGTQFIGANGTPVPFNYGNVSSGYFTNGGTPNTSEGDLNLNAFPLRNATLFGYGSFKVTDDVKLSVQLNYGSTSTLSNSYSDLQYGTLTINAGNPFIPASIAAQMAANGITSFPLGTTSINNLSGNGGSLEAEEDTLGIPVVQVDRNLYRGVVSLDGSLGDTWTWNAYYQHGESRTFINMVNNQENQNYTNAVDAVTVTSANVGTSGLPLGSVACRSTLTNPTNGCVPLDVFGTGVASEAAIAYINGAARAGQDNQITILKQDVVAASVQGELPFGLPAGHVSMATGAEYRQEMGYEDATPLAQEKAFQLANFVDFYGKYHVEEAFLEFNAPLLKDQIVNSLNFNAAGRVTEYSTSGTVETYKLGLTSQLTDDIRLRASYSFDIRAPDLDELFNAGTPVLNGAIDPRTGKGVSVFDISEGNRNLKPEQSITRSGGFILTPRWVPGLTMSLDWYLIDISQAISSFDGNTILKECAAGNQTFCSNLVFGGPGGALSEILEAPVNAASETTSGLDFSEDYRVSLFRGTFDVNAVANYTFEQTQTALGTRFDYAGSIGPDSAYEGLPKFRGTLSATYGEGPWSATVQTRLIGSAKLNNAWGPLDVDDNHIPFVYYLDLRGSYKFSSGIQVYAAVDNVTDKYPPVVPGSANAVTGFESPFRDDIYDGFGRVYRIGLRGKF